MCCTQLTTPVRFFSAKHQEPAMVANKRLFINDRKSVREAFGKSDKDALGDIEIIRNWVKSQPHLPEIPSDNMIEIFLAANKFSIEKTKQKLDMYYTVRTLIPQFYENSHPLSPEMINVPDEMGFFVLLPKQTDDHYKVTVTSFNKSAENYNSFKLFTHMLNVWEVKIQHDIAAGDIFILDYGSLKMSHVVKATPVFAKNVATILEKVFSNRIKGVHVINHPSFMDTLVTLFKTVLNPKLVDRIYLHKSVDELYGYIPREILPKDYGGDEMSIQELRELWKECLKENSDRFDKLDKMRVDEELRPTPLENDELLGYHGNFKQLNVF